MWFAKGNGGSMKQKIYLILGFSLLGLMALSWSRPVSTYAALQPTDFPTPTPGPDGRILYTVQAGDTLWRISSVSGVSLDELRQLNNLGADEVIIPGQVLLLGLAGPSETTPVPGTGTTQAAPPVLPPGLPTPTQIMDAADICVMLYADINGDTVRQETEFGIAGGEVSVTEQLGAYSQKKTTLSGDPEVEGQGLVCFENVPIGNYNVTIAIPDGYNPTTILTKALEVIPGQTARLPFGAQLSSQSSGSGSGGGTGGGDGRSSLVGILGITVLLAGIGIGVYSVFSRQSGES